MKAVSPVIKGYEQDEILLAKDQPEYEPLPVLEIGPEPRLMSRWEFTPYERDLISSGASLFYQQMTFGHRFHPVSFAVAFEYPVEVGNV